MFTRLARVSILIVGTFALLTWNQVGRIPVTPPGKGIVTGGIFPCSGAGGFGAQFAAGTVTVLQGRLSWKPDGPGYWVLKFPSHVVTRVTVGTGGTYRIMLDPGRYVLHARYLHVPRIDPFLPLSVEQGTIVHANIPDMCR